MTRHVVRRAQRGQALTEFLVVALALVPLFLLVPMIAKYQDIRHSAQLASRYAAFDAMARNDAVSSWKPSHQLADEVRRRFFSHPDAPIKTHDVAGDFKAHQNPFWRDPGGGALVRRFADVSIGFGSDNSANQIAGFESASDGMPYTLREPLGLPARGVYTVNVSVVLANLPADVRSLQPFDGLDLSLRRATSVLLDPWVAQGPTQVEARIGGDPRIYPVATLREPADFVDAAVSVIEAPGGLRGPRLGQLEFWRDVVPDDRLEGED
ncbi:hypothetical protein [Caldimonas brevitalea]|uniref:Uncharacterized protein n=1 Tax=Caldimonas brevitalea TaxID=413882 RepID=A0A0G3BW94_9BURK|nr:hypothetical protein [Caldimonas brevitalea]AKJ31671.1 hypothetical protein AAW51_4980 [Caldimonas brevitalea]